MSDKLWYLKRCDLFERLTNEQIHRLELCSRVRSFPKNTPVYLPAETADAVYLLAEGRIKICHLTEDGKQSILAFMGPGELFGELAIFDSGPREEFVETIEKTIVVMVPREEILRLIEEHPDVSIGITKLIGLRRKRIERRLKNLLFLSNRDRLIHLLLDLAEDCGTPTPDGIRLNIKLSHQDLANVIGSTRETVTVTLGQLRTEGLIKLGRQKIKLIQLDSLSQNVNRTVPQSNQTTRSNVYPLSPALSN